MISKVFLVELLADPRTHKQLEKEAGVAAGTVGKILTGSTRPRRGDPRVLALGRVLGLEAEQCFWRYIESDDDD